MRVKTWLDQPARKVRRRQARAKKAAAIAPRPVAGALRPVVRCQTVRYNMRVRAGRGFTLDEVKGAGLGRQQAQSLGVAVDHRRTNKSKESLAANVARLKEYLGKLVVFPRKSCVPRRPPSHLPRSTLVFNPPHPLPPLLSPPLPQCGPEEGRRVCGRSRGLCE